MRDLVCDESCHEIRKNVLDEMQLLMDYSARIGFHNVFDFSSGVKFLQFIRSRRRVWA